MTGTVNQDDGWRGCSAFPHQGRGSTPARRWTCARNAKPTSLVTSKEGRARTVLVARDRESHRKPSVVSAHGLCPTATAVGDEAHAASLAASVLDGGHEYGAVFTRRWVVELILDLVGYTSERDLATLRAIEPACGSGASSVRRSSGCRVPAGCMGGISHAADAIRACDLQPDNVEESYCG